EESSRTRPGSCVRDLFTGLPAALGGRNPLVRTSLPCDPNRPRAMVERALRLQTVVRDCLFLNWALRPEDLPEPPEPLRYEVLTGPQGDFVFVSAVLFRQEGMHFPNLPLPRLSYPQCNVRTYVLDGD